MEGVAKLLTPLFGQPVMVRLLVWALLGAVLAIPAAEWLRAQFYKPEASADTPAAKDAEQRPEATVPTTPEETPAAIPTSAAPKPPASPAREVNAVGSVTSTGQSGGVTAGNIDTVNQGPSDEH